MQVFIPNGNGSKAGTPEDVVAFTGGKIGTDTRGLQIQTADGAISRATPEQIVAFTAGKVMFDIASPAVTPEIQARLDRLAQFEANERETATRSVEQRAEAAYSALFEANKVLPKDKEQIVAAFAAAIVADENKAPRSGIACFAEGSPTADFSLTDFVRTRYESNTPHTKTTERAGGRTPEQAQVAVFEPNKTTTTDPETGQVVAIVDQIQNNTFSRPDKDGAKAEAS